KDVRNAGRRGTDRHGTGPGLHRAGGERDEDAARFIAMMCGPALLPAVERVMEHGQGDRRLEEEHQGGQQQGEDSPREPGWPPHHLQSVCTIPPPPGSARVFPRPLATAAWRSEWRMGQVIAARE